MSRCRLSLDHLELLQAVAQTGSLAQSANYLGLTQPALSYRLREAERRLGVELFSKERGKRVTMTPAAQRLLPTAELVLDQLTRAESDVERIARGFQYTVRLALPSRACFLWLPRFLDFLQNNHSELDVVFELQAGPAPLESLARGKVDVAVLPAKPSAEHFESRLLFSDEVMVVLPAGHTLAEASFVAPGAFAECALITDETPAEADVHAMAALQPLGIAPMRYIQAGSPETTAELVGSGFGLGLASRRFGSRWQRDNVVSRSIGAKASKLAWHVAIRRSEADGTPTEHLFERLFYWFERKDAPRDPLRDVGS
ncbi:MAG: LysR family transcriptional regulator [Alphaproteobacteria bacterium]|nr:LysR family transcriptional regulator [Rhodospirillaceae bacterium]MBT6511251.1 LysR family transcriptional regulator [Rhodospirillaceae bacterium]MBT7613696.1 LysR family transcriptional regulator [Rhodospirillaceae bacterium]MBT7646734.1 LysR family transcriptional regulator [Rhodospirillaceae bacterium]MDG2480196.1 LysR family transcriptional regulator [Alphaproteobacteria bacterium]